MWKVPANILQRRVASSAWLRVAGASCNGTTTSAAASSSQSITTTSHLHYAAVRHQSTTTNKDETVGDEASAACAVGDGYLGRILNAKVYEVAIETELQHAKNLSQLLNNTVLLKREDTQPVFSFKIRGAYNKMASLPKSSLNRGVVACSAGNHAQGVALSARMLGCRAVICMPLTTPSIKVNAVRAHGGEFVEVRLIGKNYDEAAGEAMRLQYEEGLAMIHPFDDPYVIAGQGTMGELWSLPLYLQFFVFCCKRKGLLYFCMKKIEGVSRTCVVLYPKAKKRLIERAKPHELSYV